MRPIRLLLIYLLVVFVGGALLAPWLYALTQLLAAQFPSLQHLAANPFHRFVHRSLLGLALIFLWPLFSRLGLRTWRDFGFANPFHHRKKIFAGFAGGFVSLACIAILAISFGARKSNFDLSLPALLGHILAATLTGVVVAVLEEVLFRGAIFGALRKAHSWPLAMLVSSAVYAIVHFFSHPASPATVEWSSGLVFLAKMLQGFGDFQTLIPGFFTLLLIGMILALAYQRTGNLFLSIGLHAGWIFWFKFYRLETRDVPAANHLIFGSDKIIDGWLAVPVLLLVFVVLFRSAAWKTTSVTSNQTNEHNFDDKAFSQ